MKIRAYSSQDEKEVVELWRRCDLVQPQNDPLRDIQRKLKVNDELFLVGLVNNRVVATAMGGYDGHRGWVYYLAVDPSHQRQGLGRQIMQAIEEKLLKLDCPKINLQVRAGNDSSIVFYEKIGFKTEDRVSLGKRLIEDNL